MLEPEELCEAVIGFFQPKLLAGRRRDDGRADLRAHRPGARHHQLQLRQDGLRLARACGRGAEVVLVSGPVALPVPMGRAG
jgi:phosphopantothenoylcysteine decarboxylase/phosphopantothenate--cysteine ligase